MAFNILYPRGRVVESPRDRLVVVLREIVGKEVVAPGDVAARTGLPRYAVLAMFQCLEALGVISVVYSKGSHKLYTATPVASRLLEGLESGVEHPLYAVAASHGERAAPVSVDAS